MQKEQSQLRLDTRNKRSLRFEPGLPRVQSSESVEEEVVMGGFSKIYPVGREDGWFELYNKIIVASGVSEMTIKKHGGLS